MPLSYSARSKLCRNAISQNLLNLMDEKETNLAVAVDVTAKKELLHLADLLGPHLCVLKTHVDIIEDFDEDLIVQLQAYADKHRFYLFEDRKFADIGNTVKLQYEKGIYKIAKWAHITNAHALPGQGIVQGLKEIGQPLGRGLLLLAEMSSKGSLFTESYTQACIEMAQAHADYVIGFISQRKLLPDPSFIHFTPGVSLSQAGDALGQCYLTPETVIKKNGTDIVIVGRSIIQAKNPLEEAIRHRKAAWEAYQSYSSC